jgi:hypothetical protein
MKIKITDTILSIPPYISTSWKNIAALQVEGNTLFIELITGSRVEVPNLDQPIISQIFAAHAQVHEVKKIIFPVLPGLEAFGNLWQHTPEQAGSPDLPPEFLERIETLMKTMGISDTNLLPKAEPHCNCPYCQVARVMHDRMNPSEPEEAITEEDLRFRDWDIKQEADKLYTVINPFDHKEHYNVFLGEPLGCTCGQKNCEHLQAVLRS